MIQKGDERDSDQDQPEFDEGYGLDDEEYEEMGNEENDN